MRAIAGGADINAIFHSQQSAELLRSMEGRRPAPSGADEGMQGLPVIFLACRVHTPPSIRTFLSCQFA